MQLSSYLFRNILISYIISLCVCTYHYIINVITYAIIYRCTISKPDIKIKVYLGVLTDSDIALPCL